MLRIAAAEHDRESAFRPDRLLHVLACIAVCAPFWPAHSLAQATPVATAIDSKTGATIDGATRTRVIDATIARLNELYVFPETAKKIEHALRRRQKRGDYDAVTDGPAFAKLLTGHLREVSKDRHLGVRFVPKLPDGPGAEARRAYVPDPVNCGFVKAQMLAGGIGYLKFDVFWDPQSCAPTAIAAMNFLGQARALIFDLRENGGGHPRMVALITSYLFENPTHLSDIWERATGKTEQYWTSSYVPGRRLPTEPVYVLTSARTFSGAEEFSYNLKALGRATIIGETTGGGAHPTRPERIDERFVIGVPFARSINPYTKTNWEGTGVEPHVKVAAADALATAQRLAEERLRN